MAKTPAPKGGAAGGMIKAGDGAKGTKGAGKDSVPPPSQTKKK